MFLHCCINSLYHMSAGSIAFGFAQVYISTLGSGLCLAQQLHFKMLQYKTHVVLYAARSNR